MLFGRSGSYNYYAIHVQVNSIPKGVTTHVQNKRSDFNRGTFWGHPVKGTKKHFEKNYNLIILIVKLINNS